MSNVQVMASRRLKVCPKIQPNTTKGKKFPKKHKGKKVNVAHCDVCCECKQRRRQYMAPCDKVFLHSTRQLAPV